MLSHIRITFYIIYKEKSDLQTCRHATYLNVENQAQILYFSTKQMNDVQCIQNNNFEFPRYRSFELSLRHLPVESTSI